MGGWQATKHIILNNIVTVDAGYCNTITVVTGCVCRPVYSIIIIV